MSKVNRSRAERRPTAKRLADIQAQTDALDSVFVGKTTRSRSCPRTPASKFVSAILLLANRAKKLLGSERLSLKLC